MSIYISTGGFKDQSADTTAQKFLDNDIKFIELSGGRYTPDIIKKLSIFLDLGIKFQIHNYFPPPRIPFIINLASSDENIRKQSLNHVFNSIKSCNLLNSDFYSFHSGFLCDFSISEIGKKITKRNLENRVKTIEIFLKSVEKISKFAKELGIKIMIENNVISKKNYLEFKENPFLMCDEVETANIMKNVPKNVGLLVDVAHLKVSSNSLNYDPKKFFEKCNSFIEGYHLSDNDGLKDSNDKITAKSWFWDYIKKDIGYFSIEVYINEINELVEIKKMCEKKLG